MTTSTHSHKAWTDKGGHVSVAAIEIERAALVRTLLFVGDERSSRHGNACEWLEGSALDPP